MRKQFRLEVRDVVPGALEVRLWDDLIVFIGERLFNSTNEIREK